MVFGAGSNFKFQVSNSINYGFRSSLQPLANKKPFKLNMFERFNFTGLPDRIRTCDPLIKSQLLYQLSYGEVYKIRLAKIRISYIYSNRVWK
jgi:hypothetical protein